LNNPILPQFIAAGEALTDLIRVGDDEWISKVGGSTWNVARVLAKLGAPTGFAGAISRDVFGDALYAASAAAGLDLGFLQRVDKAPLLAIVHETNPPSYYFLGDNSADLYFDPTQLPAGWRQAVRWVHFGGISLAREPLATRLVDLAVELKTNGVRISYDPNYRLLMDPRYDIVLQRMTSLADVVKVSDEDLVGLFRTDQHNEAFAKLRGWNPHAVYLYTRGAEGASLHIGDKEWTAQPPFINVVDTVGAGDASIGGLLFSLMRWPDRQWESHLRFAVAAGAAACQAAGATPPGLQSIEKLYEQRPDAS